MPSSINEVGATYSPLVGVIFVFNLIVGTGALTMPRAFASAGWALSLIFIIALAFMSYMTATFVIESMAVANAVQKTRKTNEDLYQSDSGVSDSGVLDNESKPLLAGQSGEINEEKSTQINSLFEITDRIEMGQMARIFFHKVGIYFFYISITIYLYGDLAIYAAAVPKSLRDVACTYSLNESDCNQTLSESDPCWEGTGISRSNGYRIFLAAFTLMLGPFIFFNIQKTKYLQYFTTVMRWLAFAIMIVLAVMRLAAGKGEGRPAVAQLSGVPTLFGVCVYSFMCHHSLPSLVTPIKNKSKLFSLFGADYALILGFYAVLSFTGIFAFKDLQDLYTLNFQPNPCTDRNNPITNVVFLQYFLALFPVFTLSTNFPIIGITLRNNLKTLFHREGHSYSWYVDHLVFPSVTVIPPVLLAFITNNLEFLVGVTGSYAGASIQYFIPAGLVFVARRVLASEPEKYGVNKYSSPFKHQIWLILTLGWAISCILLVTVNHIINGFR